MKHTTVLQSHGSTCVSWYLQLRTKGFCCSRVLLPTWSCWWQL